MPGRDCLFRNLEQLPQNAAEGFGGLPHYNSHDICSFLTPAAGAAARNQQDRHQKHQRPYRKDRRNQDPGPQRHRTDAQYPASAASPKHTPHAPFSLPLYTPLPVLVQKAGHTKRGGHLPASSARFTSSAPASPGGASAPHTGAHSWRGGSVGSCQRAPPPASPAQPFSLVWLHPTKRHWSR